ncbi:unnamed protein product [Clonostachys byssicola]|uniref:C2H2-type domain-containing protein n=1 Tax=Clonostachys byssicola TaxID=160290 RepID=A0A9N9UVF9_9HYPO|nr:unnamed protein product [Clonostachys byssicola]
MNPPSHNMGFCKGGGYERLWEDGQNPRSQPEHDQNLMPDENFGLTYEYYSASLSSGSGLETAAPSPGTDFSPDLRAMPPMSDLALDNLGDLYIRSLSDPAIHPLPKFESTVMNPQYPPYIEDCSLHPAHQPAVMCNGTYHPRTQSLDSCLSASMMHTGSGGEDYLNEMIVPAPSMERNGHFERANDLESNKAQNIKMPQSTKTEESTPTSGATSKTPEEEAAPVKAEVKEEIVLQTKDKSDVAQKKRKRSQKDSISEESTEELLFACPLYRKYPLQNMDCVNRKLTRIRDVKQHLLRRHLAYRCPICNIPLPSAARKEEHILEQNCTPSQSAERFGPDGITQEVHDILKKRSHRGKAPTTKWYEVWEIIFGDTNREERPFLGPMMEETAKLMRDVWDKESRSIVQDVVSDANDNQNQNDQQIEAMMAMFEKVQDRFETRIHELTSRESPSEKSSPIMAASQTLAKAKNASNKPNTENTGKVSPQPDGGDDTPKTEESGTPSLPSGSGDIMSHYTLSSPNDAKHDRAQSGLKGHTSRPTTSHASLEKNGSPRSVYSMGSLTRSLT